MRSLALLLSLLSQDLPEGKVERLRVAVRASMEKSAIPGLSAAVVLGRKVAWAEGFGQSDVENSVPARDVTSYRWASVSKVVAATAVMQLVERGKLDLDAPVQAYVPKFPDKGVKLTARHLLGHQGGVRHYKNKEEIGSTRRFVRLEDGLDFFKDDPLLFEPGTAYQYSTFGYTLLGCAVERASGMPFVDYVRKHVFEPAGMTTARDDSVHDLIPHRAQGYVRSEGKLRNSDLADTSYKVPGGGMCGSVVDLSRFAIASLDGTLLKRETLDAMSAAQKTADGKATRHGLGWAVYDSTGGRLIGHGGAQQRVAAWVGVLPEKDSAVVLLCNLEGTGAELTRLSHELLRIALGAR